MASHSNYGRSGVVNFSDAYESINSPIPLDKNDSYSTFADITIATIDLIEPKNMVPWARPFVPSFTEALGLFGSLATDTSDDGSLTMRELYSNIFAIPGGIVGGLIGGRAGGYGSALGGFAGGKAGGKLGEFVFDSLDFGPGNADVWSFSESGSVTLDENDIIGQGWEQGEKTYILHTTRTTYFSDGTKNVEQFSTEILQDGAELTMQAFRDQNAKNVMDYIQGPNGLPDPENVIPQNNNNNNNNNNDNDDGDDGAATAPSPTEKTGVVTSTKGPPGATGSVYKDPYIDGFDDGKGGATIPIILDLDGDGVEVAFGEDIYFDLDDDGFLEQTSWAAADDGFLVIDLNADGTRGAGDGVIDQSVDLMLSSLGVEGDTDLQALAQYDDNDDGNDVGLWIVAAKSGADTLGSIPNSGGRA